VTIRQFHQAEVPGTVTPQAVSLIRDMETLSLDCLIDKFKQSLVSDRNPASGSQGSSGICKFITSDVPSATVHQKIRHE
jgi:hypothetical protein